VAHDYSTWFKAALAYTVGGSISATLVGVVLGAIGRALAWASAQEMSLYLIGLLSLVLAAREWRWLNFPLPQRGRQTEKVWVHQFGFVVASAMWGLHIGLGFATWMTYGGFWILAAVAVTLGDTVYAAALMLMYWLGRSLSVWVAPALLRSGTDAIELPETILDHRQVYSRIVGFGLVWSAVVMVLLALSWRAT
jgi:hypothetical protein